MNQHLQELQTQTWSTRKGAIFVAYAADFVRSLSRSTAVCLVDGWAGAAMFGSGAWQSAGAPTTLAQVVDELSQQRSVRGILLDDDSATVRDLATRFSQQPAITVQHSTTPLDTILTLIGGAAAFCVFDGGTGMLPISGGLDRLARRFAKTELLIRYNRSAIADLFEQRSTEQQTPTLDRQFDQVFGQRQWRGIVQAASDAKQAAMLLRDLYVQTLLELQGSRFKWAAACPLTTRWGEYEYDLLFFTPDRAASTVMNDVLYAVAGWQDEDPETQALVQQHGKPQQLGLFDQALPTAEVLHAQTIERIVSDLRGLCYAQPRLWSVGDVFDWLLRTGWFGHITAQHMHAACEQLEQQGQMQRLHAAAPWNPSTLVRLKKG